MLITLIFTLHAQAGVSNTVRVLELMSPYADEKEFTVWETLVGITLLTSVICWPTLTDFHNNFKKIDFTMWLNMLAAPA